MKTKLLILLLAVHFASFSQSGWEPLGLDDFNRPALGQVRFMGRNPIMVKNDHVFLFNSEVPDNSVTNQGKHFSVSKYANNQWEHIGFPFLFPINQDPPVMDCTVDNNEIPYVIFNDITGDGRPVVRKFQNGNWMDVGADISTVTSPVLNITIGTDNLPRILYHEGNSIKLKKFDGTTWIVLSATTEFIPYTSLSLELDNNNVPHVLSNYQSSSNNYNCFVKKFNGTGWEEVGITGFVEQGRTLAFDNSNIPYLGVGGFLKKLNGSTWENITVPASYPIWMDYITKLYFNANNDLYTGFIAKDINLSYFYIKKLVNGSWQSVYNGGYSVSGNLFAASGNYVYYKNENSYLPIMYKKDSGGQAVLLGNVSFSSQANFTDSNQNRNEMLTHDFEICGAVPTIAYTRAGKAAVRRFVDDWSNWNSINISESDVTKVMIKSGTNGRIYLAYNNKISTSTTSDTKITVKELLTNTGTWQTVGGVNFSMQAGVQFDFKLNNANEPYVLYMSGRVQKFDGTNWVFVGGSAYTGDIAARLGIDTNNIPYIAFIDPSNSNHIAVKKLNGNAWDYVDQAGLSGYTGQQYRPRIVIDASNTIYLGFVDNLLRVHIKKLNNGLWESVGPDFFTTQKTDQFEMTVDNNNVLHIIYNEQHDNFRSEANVKKFNGTDWEYVGAPNFSPASIVVGKLDFSQNNTPVVAYSSNVSGGLMIDTRFFDAGTLSNEVYNPIENWTVTPNPVTAQFSINRSSEIESLEIYDVTGKKIKSLYENFTNIDVSFLSSGLYILKIKTEGGTNSIKLIKN